MGFGCPCHLLGTEEGAGRAPPAWEQSSTPRARGRGVPAGKANACAQSSSCESGPGSLRARSGADGTMEGEQMRGDEDSIYEAERCSAANTALLKETREYLPRKCSCAAFHGNWTGTGRRKRPLQGRAERPVSRRACAQVEQRTGTPSPAQPGPGEKEGRASGGGSSGHTAGSPGCVSGTWGGEGPPPDQQSLASEHYLWPQGGPGGGLKDGPSPARQGPQRAQTGTGCVHGASEPKPKQKSGCLLGPHAAGTIRRVRGTGPRLHTALPTPP